MIHKNRNNRRVVAIKKARRKKRILKDVQHWEHPKHTLGYLDKAKIHCSCSDCSPKTKHWMGKPLRDKYRYKHSDKKKVTKENYQIDELIGTTYEKYRRKHPDRKLNNLNISVKEYMKREEN